MIIQLQLLPLLKRQPIFLTPFQCIICYSDFFVTKKNIYLLKEQNKSEISLKGGVEMSYSFDYDRYKKHRPSDIRDLISDEYEYDFGDEFDYVFGDYDDFDEDNEF